MKPEHRLVLDQLTAAMDVAHPHIHTRTTSDISTYLNMIELRPHLDALWEALRANRRQCEDADSLYGNLGAELDLSRRVLQCRNWCIDLADAWAHNDRETLRTVRVHKMRPVQLSSTKETGDVMEEEEREYFAQLDTKLKSVDAFLATLTERWMTHFQKWYGGEELQRPEDEMIGENRSEDEAEDEQEQKQEEEEQMEQEEAPPPKKKKTRSRTRRQRQKARW